MLDKIREFLYCLIKKPLSFRLFMRLKKYASLPITSLCQLHEAEPNKPCPKSSFFCGNESIVKVINFDVVKDLYCKQNRIKETWQSVDAVTYKDKLFLFVEIKSWINFERFQLRPSDSEDERKRKIKEKAEKFKLKNKVERSMEICRKVTFDEHLFDKMPILYVLVTDIDTIVNPMDRFRARLGVLSYKSLTLIQFNDASVAQLEDVRMDVRYEYCRRFDQLYGKL